MSIRTLVNTDAREVLGGPAGPGAPRVPPAAAGLRGDAAGGRAWNSQGPGR